MAYVVKMPKLGLEMDSGTILEWHVEEGGAVAEGSVLADIESEKTTAEIDARESGILRRVLVAEGESVEPGASLAIVAAADEDIAALEADAGGEAESAASESASESAAESPSRSSSPSSSSASSGDVKAAPRARKRAEELGVDLTTVAGSGPGGAITEADVEAAAESGGETPAGEAASGGVEERKLSGMRRTIADRLGKSYREAVHVTEHRTADAEALLAATEAIEDQRGVDASVTDVLLVALSAALDEHPELNGTFEDGVHAVHDDHDVCVAVDVDDGLIAPVVREVNRLSLEALVAERRRVTELALSGDYTMEDLSGGTFTVTNLGVLGVESFDPVINPPQIAILGVDAVERRAVPDDAGDPVFRRHLPLDLSFDHRVVDGADAARFLETLCGHLEDPWPLLDGVEAPADLGDAGSAGVDLPERHVTARANPDLSGTVEAGSFSYDFGPDEEFGGGDSPTPVDLFLSSLSACLSASVGVQADIRDVDVAGVTVDAQASPATGSVEAIDVQVTVDTDADEDVVARMVENGERTCHVAELLREDLPITLSWTRADD